MYFTVTKQLHLKHLELHVILYDMQIDFNIERQYFVRASQESVSGIEFRDSFTFHEVVTVKWIQCF
jgi:hypothetical protein